MRLRLSLSLIVCLAAVGLLTAQNLVTVSAPVTTITLMDGTSNVGTFPDAAGCEAAKQARAQMKPVGTFTLKCRTDVSNTVTVTAVPAPATSKFTTGQVVSPTRQVNVRSTPAGLLLGIQASGARCVKLADPTVVKALNGTNVTWSKFDCALSPDGWMGEDYLALAGPAPDPTPVPTPDPTPVPTPGPNTGIPSGWDDPRFAGNVVRAPLANGAGFNWSHFDITNANGGSPQLGCERFTATFFRLTGQEGVRICGGDNLIEDFYIRATGIGADHADGIQHYIGSAGTTLRDRNGNAGYQLIARRGIVEINGSCTAGLFSADGSKGRIWLEDVKFITNTGCKGLRVNVDGGGPVSCVRCVFQNAPQVDVAVDVWENNTMLNGTPVGRP